jgi:hypothetical protein
MRNGPRSAFWRNAAQRLPEASRNRYNGYFEMAEQWELALDYVIELVADIKGLFHTPSNARSA